MKETVDVNEAVNVGGIAETKGMGWLRDYPDFRDLTPEATHVPSRHRAMGRKDSVKSMLGKIGVAEPVRSLPVSVDLRAWCSAIEDQGALGSCTANAGAGLVEYFERRAFGKHTDASRLFLYKATRNLLHWVGDTGAFLRSTMGAMAMFGVPPEEYWPYKIADYDKEPTSFCYAFAQNFQSISYYRLDPSGTAATTLLDRIKTNLAAGCHRCSASRCTARTARPTRTAASSRSPPRVNLWSAATQWTRSGTTMQ